MSLRQLPSSHQANEKAVSPHKLRLLPCAPCSACASPVWLWLSNEIMARLRSGQQRLLRALPPQSPNHYHQHSNSLLQNVLIVIDTLSLDLNIDRGYPRTEPSRDLAFFHKNKIKACRVSRYNQLHHNPFSYNLPYIQLEWSTAFTLRPRDPIRSRKSTS